MHLALEQIKQFLAPRWYKLQKYVVEFVKQFLVPKLRELQKYMVEFKERMTMKRMLVMCLLLVVVVCGVLALTQGGGKQDWEKEPYSFRVFKKRGDWGAFALIYQPKSSVKVADDRGNICDIEWTVSVNSFSLNNLYIDLGDSQIEFDLSDYDSDYSNAYALVEFSNGQKLPIDLIFDDPEDKIFVIDICEGLCDDSMITRMYDNTLIASMDDEQQVDYLASMLRSYDINSITCICYWYTFAGDLRLITKKCELLKISFKDFNSAATINAMLNDAENYFENPKGHGKLLTKGSSSSNSSSVQSNKSISPEPDDDKEEIDSVFVEKSIVIKSVETQHNVVQNGQKGMNIIINYSVEGMKGKTGGLNAYFYFEDGTPLKDGNKSSMPYYGLDNGNVAVGKQFTPRYDDVTMSGTLFMPYDELHLGKGKFSLKYYCAIFDDEIKQQATSDWQYFTFTWQ